MFPKILLFIIFYTIGQSIIAQVSYIPLKTDTDISAQPVALSVGSTVGIGEVSEGAATYTIPISVPPGTNGVVPTLNLTYNSMSGNGNMGMGWGLAGLSMISRTGKSLLNDGEVTPVNFDTNDQFILDGNRLIFTGSETITPPYGGSFTYNNYKTENETFSKIQASVGTYGNTFFTVVTKDGLLMEYGATTDSRRTSGGVVLYYKLDKILYPDGNYISFLYVNTNNDSRISEIIYTKNDQGVYPYNKILFDYDLRSDKNKIFEKGNNFINENLLTKITTKVDFSTDTPNGTLVKTYELKYSELKYGLKNINSFLAEIIETGSDGISKFNSTIFKYGTKATEYEGALVNFGYGASVDLQSGDFDGDGYTDIIAKTYTNSNGVQYDTSIKLYKRTASNSTFAEVGNVNLEVNNKIYVDGKQLFQSNATIGDYDGNATDDLLSINTTKSGDRESFNALFLNKNVYNNGVFSGGFSLNISPTATILGDYKYFPTNGRCLFTGDFDGNGIQDIITLFRNSQTGQGQFTYRANILYNKPANYTNNLFPYQTINIQKPNASFDQEARTWANTNQVFVLDHDGDGKSDLMVNEGSVTTIYSFSGGIAKIIYSATNIFDGFARIYLGDFNGDRKTDLLYRNSENTTTEPWFIAYSMGNGFETSAFSFEHPPVIIPSEIYNSDQIIVGDYNADGKSDIYHGWRIFNNGTTNSSKIDMYYSTGDSFSLQANTSQNLDIISYHDNYFLTDINGDGRGENMNVLANDTGPNNIMYFNKGGNETVLEKVRTGIGHVTEFNYKRLTEASTFYSQGLINPYPLNNIQSPIYAVSSIKTPNGIGLGKNQIDYSYVSAKLHKGGRGFLGFEKIISYDLATGFKTTNQNEFDGTYFIALPQKVTVQEYVLATSSWENISITNIVNILSPLTLSRFFHKTSKTETHNFIDFKSNSQSNFYDSDGNVYNTIVTSDKITNANIPVAISNIETISTVTNTIPKTVQGHIIFKPSDITITKSRINKPNYVLKTDFTWDNIGRLVTKKDFANKTDPIITSLEYNTLGNVIKTTITPTDATLTRIKSSTYDISGRFELTNTNELGQVSSATYDSKWGTVKTLTGIDGLVTTFHNDALGKLTSTDFPEGFSTTQTYGWDFSNGAINYTLVSHPGKPDTKTWFDILNREIKSETDGLNSEKIYTEQTFDEKGNLKTSKSPYKIGETPMIITYNYDQYNRPTSSASDIANFGTTYITYASSNGNRTITTTKPDDTISSKTYDAADKLVSATDAGGTIIYEYDAQGNITSTSHGGVVINSSIYDEYGRQTSLTDKNAGTTSYAYDKIGQMISETNPQNETHTLKYNLLGQIVERGEPGGVLKTIYEFNATNSPGTADINQLKKVTNFTGNTEEYTYNDLGNLVEQVDKIDGKILTTSITYNIYEDVLSKTFPSGLTIDYEYDENGFNKKIKTGSTTLYENIEMDGLLQNTQYKTHNGAKTNTNTFHYGYPLSKQTSGIQNLSMVWNYTTGNLTSRTDNLKPNIWETFTYDNLNRLLTSKVNNQNQITISYASSGSVANNNLINGGNISSKTLVGDFTYHANKINAVISVTNPTLTIPLLQQDITYNSFQQPTSIIENGFEINYTYGSDYNRIKSILKQNGNEINKKYYFGDYEESITDGSTKQLHYIGSPAGLIAIIENTNIIHYISTDHLGSIVATTNNSGNIEYELSFDAWGSRRDPNTWGVPYATNATTGLPDWLYRGYTGHEHLGQIGLINMNARLYDPVLGRMLSPDNLINDLSDTQSFNRFNYARNNPLKYIDTDGNDPFLAYLFVVGIANTLSQVVQNKGFKNFKWNMVVGSVVSAGFTAIAPVAGKAVGGATSSIAAGIATRFAFQGIGGGINSLNNGGTFDQGFGMAITYQALSFGVKSIGGIRNMIENYSIGKNITPNYFQDSPSTGVDVNDPWEVQRMMMGFEMLVYDIVTGKLIASGLKSGYSAVRAYFSAKQVIQHSDKLLLNAVKLHRHHVLPQQFKKWFAKRGINDIDNYTVEVSKLTHLKGIHGNGMNKMLQGKWNNKWAEFIKSNQNASPSEIFHHAEGLLKSFGLDDLPYVPYK